MRDSGQRPAHLALEPVVAHGAAVPERLIGLRAPVPRERCATRSRDVGDPAPPSRVRARRVGTPGRDRNGVDPQRAERQRLRPEQLESHRRAVHVHARRAERGSADRELGRDANPDVAAAQHDAGREHQRLAGIVNWQPAEQVARDERLRGERYGAARVCGAARTVTGLLRDRAPEREEQQRRGEDRTEGRHGSGLNREPADYDMALRPASLGHFCDREGSLLRHQKRRLMRRRNSCAAPLPDQDTRASFVVPFPSPRRCLLKKPLVALLAAVELVATVPIIGRLTFASRQPQVAPVATEPLDSLPLAGRLPGAVPFRTISYQDSSQFDAREFDGLYPYLRDAFPRLHAALALEKVNGYGLLYRWAGSDSSLAPILLLAHQDVVPVEPGTEGRWTEPPFAGRISAGFVWGRGALDDKG